MNWFIVIFYLALFGWTAYEGKRRLRVEANRRDARETRLVILLRQARSGLIVADDPDEQWRAQRDIVVAAIDATLRGDAS